jgi:hypothetical protein
MWAPGGSCGTLNAGNAALAELHVILSLDLIPIISTNGRMFIGFFNIVRKMELDWGHSGKTVEKPLGNPTKLGQNPWNS